jgi:hypothetical protein
MRSYGTEFGHINAVETMQMAEDLVFMYESTND